MKLFNRVVSVMAVPLSLVAYIVSIKFENAEYFWEIESWAWGKYIFLPLCIACSIWMLIVHKRSRWLPLLVVMSILTACAIMLVSFCIWRVVTT